MTTHIDPRTAELSLWLLLCTGLAVFIGQQVDWGRQLRMHPKVIPYEAASYVPPAVSSPPQLEAADRYLEAVERPLFVFTRRPAPPPPPPSVPSTMKKGQFKLSGVSIVDGQKLAFLVEISTGRTKVVREGEKINEMTLQKVEPGFVNLTQGNDQEPLELKIVTSGKSTAPGTFAPPGNVSVPAPGASLPGSAPNASPAPANTAPTLSEAVSRAVQLRTTRDPGRGVSDTPMTR